MCGVKEIDGSVKNSEVGGAQGQLFEAARIRQGGELPQVRRVGRHYIFDHSSSKTRYPCANCLWNFGSSEASKAKCKTRCEKCRVYLHLECFESFHEDEKPVSGRRFTVA